MTVPYLDTPYGWDKVVKVIRAKGVCGWDSETYGHEVDESTPVGRARVHVWSLAVATDAVAPRGHHVAAGVVLPAAALEYPPLRDLLQDAAVVKWAWNAPHDVHSAAEHGVQVHGWRDGLPLARVALPHLPRHGLKTVGPHLTGKEMSTYKDVLTMDVEEYVDSRVCSCQGPFDGVATWEGRAGRRRGAEAVGSGGETSDDVRVVWRGVRCPKRGRSSLHRSLPAWLPKMVPRLQPLESVVPGHPLWDRLLVYAAEDAVIALECGERLEHLGSAGPYVEWFPGGRPT